MADLIGPCGLNLDKDEGGWDVATCESLEPLRTAYEVCWNCRGAGLQDGIYGPVTCSDCHGECVVRVRDGKGRFATRETINGY